MGTEVLQLTIDSLVTQMLGTCVPQDVPLMEAGLDSLAASEVVQSIGSTLETELPTTLLFDHPSIAAICHYVR